MSRPVQGGRWWAAGLAATLTLCAGSARAGEGSGGGLVVYEADLAGAKNPDGLLLTLGGFRRWPLQGEAAGLAASPYLQAGGGVAVSPAYAAGKVHGEWMPHPALQLRAQYSWIRYFGDYAALLSFPSGDAAFGRREVDELEGEEEAAWGQRLLLRPILRFKYGPLLVRNVTDFAFCRFDGQGPYFLEWDYCTLVKDSDWIISDSIQLPFKIWSGPGAEAAYAGPFFEITHAEAADITQERAGLIAAWTLSDRLGPLTQPRAYLQAGMHLRDPNREGEFYVVFGVGFDLD